jgi:serine/threonine protein kinase
MSSNPADRPEADVPTVVPTPTPEQTDRAAAPDAFPDQAASPDNADPDGTNYTPSRSADPDGTNYSATPSSDPNKTSDFADRSLTHRTSAPRRIGKYELLREINAGGMGIVYEALDVNLGRRVALSRILPHVLFAHGTIERFRLEAQAAARLHHPGIVQVHDEGVENGQPYIVMELANGGSLQEHLADGPLPPRLAADVIRQLAEAVQYAHDHGIVHRDL